MSPFPNVEKVIRYSASVIRKPSQSSKSDRGGNWSHNLVGVGQWYPKFSRTEHDIKFRGPEYGVFFQNHDVDMSG